MTTRLSRVATTQSSRLVSLNRQASSQEWWPQTPLETRVPSASAHRAPPCRAPFGPSATLVSPVPVASVSVAFRHGRHCGSSLERQSWSSSPVPGARSPALVKRFSGRAGPLVLSWTTKIGLYLRSSRYVVRWFSLWCAGPTYVQGSLHIGVASNKPFCCPCLQYGGLSSLCLIRGPQHM